MSIKTTRRQVIREVPWGMLVWQFPDGTFAADGEGNFMHVFLQNTSPDLLRAAAYALRDAARSYGMEEGGKPVFWSGRRPIDDEQLEHQLERAGQGLVPDPFDIAAIQEEAEALHRHD